MVANERQPSSEYSRKSQLDLSGMDQHCESQLASRVCCATPARESHGESIAGKKRRDRFYHCYAQPGSSSQRSDHSAFRESGSLLSPSNVCRGCRLHECNVHWNCRNSDGFDRRHCYRNLLQFNSDRSGNDYSVKFRDSKRYEDKENLHSMSGNSITLLLVLSYVTTAQPPGGAATHFANGVIEMVARPTLAFERAPRSQVHGVYGPWAGLVEVTIRNISRSVIRLNSTGARSDFTVDIRDADGKPVALTVEGRRAEAYAGQFPAISVSQIELAPLEEKIMMLDLSWQYEIRTGQEYRVTIRRSRGIPRNDAEGKPLKKVEVSCSFEVPDYGILR